MPLLDAPKMASPAIGNFCIKSKLHTNTWTLLLSASASI